MRLQYSDEQQNQSLLKTRCGWARLKVQGPEKEALMGCCSGARKYVALMMIGVIGGAVLTAYTTRAIPRMMSGMMRNMMGEMQKEGCNPREM